MRRRRKKKEKEMLFGLLEDSSWLYFLHAYVVPLYTYWYYFGPLLLVVVPFLRLSYGSIKYFLKMLLLLCAEVVDFLTETTQNKMMEKHIVCSDSDEDREEDEDNQGFTRSDPYNNVVSAEDMLESVQRVVTKMARYCILGFILLIPVWFFLSIPFMYYNNHAECHQDYLSHMHNVKECEERGYTAPDFRNLCVHSKKQIQKSVVYCSLQGTMEDLQVFFWNTLCSPFVLVYLLFITVLGLVRSGIRFAKQKDTSIDNIHARNSTTRPKGVPLYKQRSKECAIKME
jgi:hypothetical protein